MSSNDILPPLTTVGIVVRLRWYLGSSRRLEQWSNRRRLYVHFAYQQKISGSRRDPRVSLKLPHNLQPKVLHIFDTSILVLKRA